MGPTLAVLIALASSSPGSDAAVRLYRGDAAGALRATESALGAAPDDHEVRVVATCAAIELGDLRRADALLRPLEGRAPSARAAVLRRLIERRRSSKAPLMHDLVLSWKDAGPPELSDADPTQVPASEAPLPPIPASAVLSPGERLLFAPPDGPEAQRALALAAAAEADRNPLVVNLQVLGVLGLQPCPADAAGERGVVTRAREAAARALPRNGYVTVAGWLACRTQPLDADAVALLAGAAERLDGANARVRAISAWLAPEVPFWDLAGLAETIEEPAVRRAAGRALAAIGLRMAEGTAWLERFQGWAVAGDGARLCEGESAAAQAQARAGTERAVYQQWETARQAIGSWPFAAVWREWTPDEVAATHRMARLLSATAPVDPPPAR